MESSAARLVWEKTDGDRVEFRLVSSPMLVGRDTTAEICVNEPLVSWAHARIERRGDSYVVCDLGSTNLTRVNGEVVVERELKHGDEIRFARAKCVFLADRGDAAIAGGV